jgi:DNA polymerase III delta subunit
MLGQILEEKGLKMDSGARQLFLAKVGGNTRHMVNEAEKLALYVGGAGSVGVADVQSIVSASTEAAAWDLADAFGRRQLTEALNILRQLLFQKESPIRLIMGLEGRVRELMIYRDALDRGWLKKGGSRGSFGWVDVGPDLEVVFGEYFERDPRKIHPFRVGLLAEQAVGFSRKRLVYCLEQVTEAHAKLVSSRVPQEMTLELLLVRMLVGVKRRRK